MTDVALGYRLLRTGAGVVAVDRDVVRVHGPDATTYLQGQLSQDVAAMAPGTTAWSLLLQPQGKVDAWLRVTRTADDDFVLDVDGGFGEAVVARLRRFLLRMKVDLDIVDWSCLAVRGPGAPAAGEPTGEGLVVAFAWPSFAGYDLLGPEPAPPAGVEPVGVEAYEVRRIEAGVPRMGAELTDKTIPAEAGIVGPSVSFSKGCYTGQELVARIDSRGGHVPRRLVGLELAERPDPGADVEQGGRVVGHVTSAVAHPEGGAVGLAYVRRDADVPGPAVVAGGAGTIRDLPLVS